VYGIHSSNNFYTQQKEKEKKNLKLKNSSKEK